MPLGSNHWNWTNPSDMGSPGGSARHRRSHMRGIGPHSAPMTRYARYGSLVCLVTHVGARYLSLSFTLSTALDVKY